MQTQKAASTLHQNQQKNGKMDSNYGHCISACYPSVVHISSNDCLLLKILYNRFGRESFWIASANMVAIANIREINIL